MRPVLQSPTCKTQPLASDRWIRPLLFRAALIAASILTTCAGLATAQAPAAGSNWDHLKALPPNTRLHVSTDKKSYTCKLTSADDASLVCGKYSLPRAEVKDVKLTRYGISYGAGAAIGAGIGAGLFIGVNNSDKGSFIFVNEGKAAGAGLLVGGVIGTLLAGPADLFRGPTVYRRQ